MCFIVSRCAQRDARSRWYIHPDFAGFVPLEDAGSVASNAEVATAGAMAANIAAARAARVTIDVVDSDAALLAHVGAKRRCASAGIAMKRSRISDGAAVVEILDDDDTLPGPDLRACSSDVANCGPRSAAVPVLGAPVVVAAAAGVVG